MEEIDPFPDSLRPETPKSISESFYGAGDSIPNAEATPPRLLSALAEPASACAIPFRGPERRPSLTRMTSRSSLRSLPWSSRSLRDPESISSRFREHGPVFQSTYRSVSSCSFGKAKRNICEHSAQATPRKASQEVIPVDQEEASRASAAGTVGKYSRIHWSQDKQLLPDKWLQQVQRGHHSPPGSPHDRSMIFNRTAAGNQTIHDFFE
jgi:hypothetical protein